MSNKITPEAKHRRSRETLCEQLIRNQEKIRELVEHNRKIDWAIRIHDECKVNGILIGDQSDIDFALKNDG